MEIASLIISILSLILGIVALILAIIFWKTTYREFKINKKIKNMDLSEEGTFLELSKLYLNLLKENPDIEAKHFKKNSNFNNDAKTAIGNMIINLNKLNNDGENNDL